MTDQRFHYDPMGDLGRAVAGKLEDARHRVRQLPHAAATAVTDTGRGFSARALTAGESRQVVEAFGYQVMPERVRIVDGPGTSVPAAGAFLKGNPAITLGNTIHFKPGRHRADFSLLPEDAALLVHEWTHVTQYARMGYGAFAAQYGRDLSHHGFDPDKLYAFHGRKTTFAQETLEGQAEMAGVLTLLRRYNKPTGQGSRGALERRMAGSGVYGL